MTICYIQIHVCYNEVCFKGTALYIWGDNLTRWVLSVPMYKARTRHK